MNDLDNNQPQNDKCHEETSAPAESSNPESTEKNPILSFLSVVVLGTVGLEIITLLVFLIIGKFSVSVIYGALWGTAVMSVYYLLMAKSIAAAAGMEDADAAKKRVQASYSLRLLFVLIAMGAGLYLSVNYGFINWIPMLLAVVYPRISIVVWQIFNKNK